MVTNLQKYQKQSFSSLLYLWLPLISKRSPLKVSLLVKLLLLTLRTRFLVGNLKKKIPVIPLYWFSAQQHTSTC